MKGVPLATEVRQLLSKLAIQRALERGNYADKKFKKGTYSSPKAGDIKYDSSYEERAYEILDALPEVGAYSKCNFYLKYQLEDGTHRYIPDIKVFYTDKSISIIEVKPAYQLKTAECLAKFAVGRAYAEKNNMKFKVWSEKDLFLNGIYRSPLFPAHITAHINKYR